jgi:hypothetical protein
VPKTSDPFFALLTKTQTKNASNIKMSALIRSAVYVLELLIYQIFLPVYMYVDTC